MKAIILAGGRSTRLGGITKNRPKCLLTFGGTTIIDNQLQALKTGGVNDVAMVTGFEADILEAHVTENHPEISFTFVRDLALKGPAYGLWLARDHFAGPIIYLNADLLCDPAIIQKIAASDRSSTAIQKVEWNEEAVNVVLDDEGKVIEIGKEIERDRSDGEFIGATYLDETFAQELVKALESLDYDEKNHFAVDAIHNVIKAGGAPLYGYDVSDHTALEIDTVDDYEEARRIWSVFSKRE